MVAYAEQLVEFYCEAAGLDKSKTASFLPGASPENQATKQELEIRLKALRGFCLYCAQVIAITLFIGCRRSNPQ